MVDSFLSLVFEVFFEAAMTGGKSRCTTTYIRGYIHMEYSLSLSLSLFLQSSYKLLQTSRLYLL